MSRKVIEALKYEFLKMGNAVNKISTEFEVEEERQTVIPRIQFRLSQQSPRSSKKEESYSPVKSIKFDINGYFNRVRQDKDICQSHFYLAK